jgi:hypothetical protein
LAEARTTDNSSDAREIAQLVLGIARLGEQDQRGWWRGHAVDRTGQYVLSNMFPRTWRPAALQLDVAAAARLHDELLGRATALHLFSDGLSFRRWTIGWLGEQKTSDDGRDLLRSLESSSEDQLVSMLREWCGLAEPPSGDALGNGMLLGHLDANELENPRMLARIARLLCLAYLDQTRDLRPPYFDLTR